ncbi:MAG: tetratricopeptide repeat protein [Polyangiaceae bacterium]
MSLRAPSVLVALLLSALATLLVAGCAKPALLPERAVTLNREGTEAFAREDLVGAEARFALALEYHPSFTEAHVNLGLVALRRGAFGDAERHFRKARSLNPDLPVPHHALGSLAERRFEFGPAERHYEAALAVDPGFLPARLDVARLYFRRHAFDQARAAFERLVVLAPDLPAAHTGRIETLLAEGRSTDASEAVLRAREHAGTSPELDLLDARARISDRGTSTDDRASARALLESLTTSPVAGRAYAWIAVLDAEEGDVPAARKHAARALVLAPEDEVGLWIRSRVDPKGPSNRN